MRDEAARPRRAWPRRAGRPTPCTRGRAPRRAGPAATAPSSMSSARAMRPRGRPGRGEPGVLRQRESSRVAPSSTSSMSAAVWWKNVGDRAALASRRRPRREQCRRTGGTRGRWGAAGAGVRVAEVAELLERGHLVADRGRGHAEVPRSVTVSLPTGSPDPDVLLDDRAQHRLLPGSELASFRACHLAHCCSTF